MTTVTEDFDLPGGANPSAYRVLLELCGDNGLPIVGFHPNSGKTIAGPYPVSLATSGAFSASVNLLPNAEITPVGTVYRRYIDGPGLREQKYFEVPITGSDLNIQNLLTDPPGAIASSALTTHERRKLDDGVHGIIEHNWTRDGWTPFNVVVITDDPTQAYARAVSNGIATITSSPVKTVNVLGASRTSNVVTLTVASGHGITAGMKISAVDLTDNSYDISSSAPNVTSVTDTTIVYPQTAANDPDGGTGTITFLFGNHREAYLHESTWDWVDAEVTSPILPPNKWLTNNAQQGHLHRVREISPGVYEGIAIWTSVVFGGTFHFMHVSAVRFDGTQAGLKFGTDDGGAGGTDSVYLDRTSTIQAYQRFTGFGLFFNTYKIANDRGLMFTLADTDVVTIASMPVASFNETNIAISAPTVNENVIQVIDPVDTAIVPWTASPVGTVVPSGTSQMKRWAPFYMSTRVVGGTSASLTVELVRWRSDESRPPWSHPRVRRVVTATDADMPAIAEGPGYCGLWAAHGHSDTIMNWGDVTFKRLS